MCACMLAPRGTTCDHWERANSFGHTVVECAALAAPFETLESGIIDTDTQ